MSIYDLTGVYTLTAQVATTDATVTTCGYYTMPDECTAHFDVTVMGRETGTALTVVYRLIANYRRETGSVAAVNALNYTSLLTNEDATCTAADAAIDSSGNDVRVRVTGIAARPYTWQTTITVNVYKA